MAKPTILITTIYLLLLAITLGFASSARILDEGDPQSPVLASEPEAEIDDPDVAPVVGPITTLPNGQIPVTGSIPPVGGVAPLAGPAIPLPSVPGPVIPPSTPVTPVATPATTLPGGPPSVPRPVIPPSTPVTPVATPATTLPGGPPSVPGPVIPPSTTVTPVATPATTLPGGPAATATTATAANGEPQLAFFMHDILGGTHPSGRVVTGIIANSQANGLPFSKANSQVFPINGGVPLNNINGIVNNDNVPLLVGLNGSPTSTTFQNSGNNNVVNGGNNLPFVSAGQLPDGLTLQQLMFGSITVVDNELTEGHELGSSVLGRGQGFYLASSLDGTSHTLALTTLFHGGDHDHVDDTISLFGVHRTGSPVSHIAVIGGTGKYEHAKGYATIETLHQGDQHTTDGVETVTHFTVYLTYP